MSLHFYQTHHFVQRLIDNGTISDDQLTEAIELRQGPMYGIDLVTILASLGYIDLHHVCQDIAARFDIDFVTLADREIPESVIGAVDRRVAWFFRVVPYYEEAGILFVALDDPTNMAILQRLEGFLNRPLIAAIATPDDISAALGRYYAQSPAE